MLPKISTHPAALPVHTEGQALNDRAPVTVGLGVGKGTGGLVGFRVTVGL